MEQKTNDQNNRVYVSVTVCMDEKGNVIPQSIQWLDGRHFAIERIWDIRHSCPFGHGVRGDMYIVKIGGKKLYELARKGQSVERKPRKITIFELELLDGEGDSWRIRVRCSKGTYVRTLCKDIGEKLGCGGCMESLVRTKAGVYTLGEAVDLQEFLSRSEENRLSALRGVDTMFSGLPRVLAEEKQEQLIRNGASYRTGLEDGEYRVYNENHEFLMLGKAENGQMKTVKSFFEVK